MIKAELLRAGEPSNVSGLCSPLTLLLSRSGNPQTLEYTGAAGLTIEATSLGNSGVADGFYPTELFQTTTEEVKYELTMTKNTTTAGSFSARFIQGVTIICGLQYNESGGTLVDSDSGATLHSGITATLPFTIAVYIKSDGTSRYAAGNGSIEYSGSLSVDAAYNNANDNIIFASINAGNTTGQELDIVFNGGNSAFVLGEDAKRWCEV